LLNTGLAQLEILFAKLIVTLYFSTFSLSMTYHNYSHCTISLKLSLFERINGLLQVKCDVVARCFKPAEGISILSQ
jgi:hypothetical protein